MIFPTLIPVYKLFPNFSCNTIDKLEGRIGVTSVPFSLTSVTEGYFLVYHENVLTFHLFCMHD